MRRMIRTTCGGCQNCCAMDVEVEGNRVVRAFGVPEDQRSNGTICARGLASPQIAHDPRRVLQPLRLSGPRGSGKFKRVSWEAALAELADKMLAAKASGGPQSVLFARGQAAGWGFAYDMLQRLTHAFGTEPAMAGSECFIPRAIGEIVTYGAMPQFHDYEHTDLMIFWGRQPSFSGTPQLRKIFDARTGEPASLWSILSSSIWGESGHVHSDRTGHRPCDGAGNALCDRRGRPLGPGIC